MEKETAAYLAPKLKALGYDVTEGVGGYGVVAVFKNGPGKTVLVRADMDGLPVKEETGVPYASKVVTKNAAGEDQPAMHACGHDIHMTGLIGTAQRMMAEKENWSGTLVLVLQPAEETVKGAPAMIEDGLFTRFPRPDYNLALHVNAGMPAGDIGLVSGYALANVDTVDLEFYGVGGHGAYPHTTKDPVVLAAQFIVALQTVVSREVSPLESAVITVGSIHGGSKHNIIGEHVKLQLTVRSYKDDVREQTLTGIDRIATNLAEAMGFPEDRMPKMTVLDQSAPSTFNNPDLTLKAEKLMKAALGDEKVSYVSPVMAAEDFSHFGRTEPKIPSLIFWLGGVNKKAYDKAMKNGEKLPSLHSPFFAPDPEPTLKAGVDAMSATAIGLFNEKD